MPTKSGLRSMISRQKRERVIGFGYLSDIRGYDEDDPRTQFVVVKRRDRIAPENASTVLTSPLDTDTSLTRLLEEHRELEEPLFAPALFR